MLRVITHLQKKPLHVRKGVAFIVAVAITLPILTLWVFSIPFVGGTQNIAGVGSVPGPFSLMREEVIGVYDEVRRELGEVPELEYVSSQ